MLEQGLNVTINTDDPGISGITMSEEYQLACEGLGLPFESLEGLTLAAAQASFLPENEKQALISQLGREQRLHFP
jgi:adenosine deaminase